MGQEIFYCGTCKTILRTRDLEKGDAFRVDDHIFCKACLPQPPATPRAGKGSDSAHQRISSSRTPRQPMAASAPPKTSTTPVILAAGGGLALILVLVIVASSSGKPPPRREEPVAPTPPVVVTPTPVEPRPEPRVVEPRPNPKPVNREVSARKLLDDARAFLPDNLDGALERVRIALLEAAGTAVEVDARSLETEILAKIKERRAALEARVKAALEKEKYGEAIGLLEKLPDGAPRVAETRLAAEKAWTDLKDKMFAARKKGADAEVKALSARAEAWGLPAVRDELAKILASPVDVDPPAEVLAWRKKLAELPLPLDYAAALKDLEKLPGADKADLEALRLASEVQRDLPALFPKLKPGAEIRLERFDEAWNRVEVAGKILRVTAHEIDVAGEALPAVDVTPAAWCELLKAKPRAAQVWCALEGDVRPGGDPLPPNILALGERMARELRTPAEAAARRLFAEAERDFGAATSRLAAGPKYLALSKDPTTYARRAKGVVDERLAASQDVFLTYDDLMSGGQFVATEAIKGTPTFTMTADGRGGDSYVQVEAALGESTRCWVYAGACCLEFFTLGLQAPDLMGPNPKDPKEQISFTPGAAFALPLKVSSIGLRAKHAHNGRDLKWLWVNVPLPKYAAAGPRKFRLVGERDGLSIAYVWLSVGRPGPPREAEVKEFEKARPVVEPPPVQTGTLLREWWLNAQGDKIPQLLAATGFPEKPTGSDRITLFEGPENFNNDYGTRVRGYVHAPLTGDYVFFVTSDDDSELWLSLDDSPNRRRRIAGVSGSTSVRGWDNPNASKSAPIRLTAGRRYFVELLHKEGGGQDHFAVGWQLPDGVQERPIPGNRLSPWLGPVVRGAKAFYRGINFAGPALVIDGHSWEGKDAPNVAVNGGSFDNQTVPLEPPVEGPKAQMLRDCVWRKEGLTATMTGVPAGRYQIYVYIWEDNSNEIFDILLNNRVVKEKHNSGAAGHWEKIGPWAVDVLDGKIELKTTGPADANLCGLEVWKVR